MGYTEAQNIINEGINKHQTTHLGDKDDATSLENMRATLSYIKECNRLRQENHLEALKVNATMMAIAQVQLNHTTNAGGFEHSKLYNVGENIASTLEKEYPVFELWYHNEKKVSDYLDQNGIAWDDIKNDDDKRQEIADILGLDSLSDVQVGHYKNIVKEKYVTTGFAINTVLGPTVASFGQVFAYGSSQYSKDGMDVDVFFAQFEEYYQSVMNAQGRYDEAKAKIEAMKQELKTQLSALESANQVLAEKQAMMDKAKESQQIAENGMQSASERISQLEQEIASLESGEAVQEAQAKIEQLNAQKTSLLEEQKKAQAEVDSAKADSESFAKTVEEAKKTLDTANSNVKIKQEALDNYNKGDVSEILAQLNQAKEETKVAEKAKDDALSTLNTFKNHTSLHEQAVAELQASLDEAKEAHAQAEASVTEKESILSKAQDHLKFLLDKVSYVEELEKEIVVIQGQIVDLETFQKEAPEKIQTVSDKIATLELAYTKDEARLKEIQSIKEDYEVLVKAHSAEDVTIRQTTLTELHALVDAVIDAYAKEASAKTDYEAVKADYEMKRTTYMTAKNAYDNAKAQTNSAMQALQEYLDSFNKPSEEPTEKPSTEDKKEETTSSTKTEETANTGVATGTTLSVAGMLAGLAGIVGLKKKKDNE